MQMLRFRILRPYSQHLNFEKNYLILITNYLLLIK